MPPRLPGDLMNGFTDKCPRHPAHAAWKCPDCDAATTPPPENWRDGLTLTRRDRPKARTEPTPDRTRIEQIRARSEHDCSDCADCIHDGNKCCGCYDGVCCKADA